jgi:hypothetical protein
MHRKLLPPLWSPRKSKQPNNEWNDDIDGYYWNVSADNQQQKRKLDRIPTAIEYSSSSSDSASKGEEVVDQMERSRYYVPMDTTSCNSNSSWESNDNDVNKLDNDDDGDLEQRIPDKYCVVIHDHAVENLDEVTFEESWDNDSFTSDTNVGDEIQRERERIKQLYIQQSSNKNSVMTKSLFSFSNCFDVETECDNSPSQVGNLTVASRRELPTDFYLQLD